MAGCLEAVGIAYLLLSPRSPLPQRGLVPSLLGLARVSSFSQEASLLASKVSGFTELAGNGSLPGTIQEPYPGGGRVTAFVISLQSMQHKPPERPREY